MALYITPPKDHQVPSNQKHVHPAALHSRSPSMDSKVYHPGSNSSRSSGTHERTRNVDQGSSSSSSTLLPQLALTSTPPSERKPVLERLVAQTTGSQELLTQEYPTGTPGRLGLDTSPPVISSTPQSGVSNAYYLKLEMSEQVVPGTAHMSPLKHKQTLSLPRLVTGFTNDLSLPISQQRSPSENSPWPYDPSSYYNIARSPTVGKYPKPKAYPLGWEENGGLTRPLSIAGIDLLIPLSPKPMVPAVPEEYNSKVPEVPHSGTGQRAVYDHERAGNGALVSERSIPNQEEKKKKRKKKNQRMEQQTTVTTAPPKNPKEYIPKPSSLEYLVELWELAAHGKFLSHRVQPKKPVVPKSQHLEMPEGVFTLNMFRGTPPNGQQSEFYGFTPEHFSFGPTPFDPFYIIQATPDELYPDEPMDIDPSDPASFFNDLVILRRNPVTHTDTSVLTMALNSQPAKAQQDFVANGQSQSPHNKSPAQGDEIITLIFPKQAVMMALDSSANHVNDENAQTLAREAVKRAAETECCRLSWDEARGRYYLYHPGIGHGGEVYLVVVDDGNFTDSDKPAKRSPGAGLGVPGAKGSIKLINVDTSEAIVVLDFNSGLLFVNTVATRQIPSLYIIDVAVSTVLAVAVVEGRRIRAQQKLLSFSMPPNGRSSNNYLYQSQSYGGASQDMNHSVDKSGKSRSDLTLGATFTDRSHR